MILDINFGAAIHLDKDLQSVSSLKKENTNTKNPVICQYHITSN